MSAPPDLPGIVARAFDVSRKSGYVSFCRNETGRLLAALAASRPGTLAEFGTGTGVGTAWPRRGMREGSRIVTAELEPKLAKGAAEIFEDDEQAEVVAADWATLRDKGPFSLLLLDAGEPKDGGSDTVIGLVERGGVVVLDDFTPCASWPPVFAGRGDTLRQEWLSDEGSRAVEVLVADDASAVTAPKP